MSQGGFYGGAGNSSTNYSGLTDLFALKARVRELEAAEEERKKGAVFPGYVIDVYPGHRALIGSGGARVNLFVPEAHRKNLRVGAPVLLQQNGILGVGTHEDSANDIGPIARVVAVRGDHELEVGIEKDVVVVRHGFVTPPKKDDRVVLDSTTSVVIRNLGQKEDSFSFRGDTGVSWDDIGGLAEAKRDLHDAIELPFLEKDLFSAYGQRPPRGILLYGPPGCGKTMLAKAATTSLAKIHGKDTVSTGFLYVKGPELLNKYVGETEQQIRTLFARCREHFRTHGYPALLFLDEADALLGKRGERREGMETTVVPQFLAEMDGLDEPSCIVLLATNRPDTLDPAVVRDGRVDCKVRVPRPTRASAKDILGIHLRNKPIAGFKKKDQEKGRAEMADAIVTAVFEVTTPFYVVHLKGGKKLHVTLEHLLNGGMLATVVDVATRNAIRRDRERGDGKPTGLSMDDLRAAVEAVRVQNEHLNHDEAVEDVIEPIRNQVEGVTSGRQADVPPPSPIVLPGRW